MKSYYKINKERRKEIVFDLIGKLKMIEMNGLTTEDIEYIKNRLYEILM